MKDVAYYLSKGFDRPMAEYFAAGRRTITAVSANPDFTLTMTFDNGEQRLFDCKDLLEEGTVFETFLQYENFRRVYIDEQNSICWDIDPTVDSDVVWNNKVDISTDVCYVQGIPLKGADNHV